jgi:hypothetical protein
MNSSGYMDVVIPTAQLETDGGGRALIGIERVLVCVIYKV